MQRGLVGSEMCIRDRYQRRVHGECFNCNMDNHEEEKETRQDHLNLPSNGKGPIQVRTGGSSSRSAQGKKKKKKDFFGTKIEKDGKRHHISFRDIMGESIADVKEVESYKEFNQLVEETPPQCSCLLIQKRNNIEHYLCVFLAEYTYQAKFFQFLATS
eukprot:TRINITY_DN6237_c0_g1_i5.p1 TRINITY_DN6237_c0_g1~~TRINITY_DN6237_c0_g1_i5.p1  ORF type:complete len:158 (+),score=37.03 TRINITY_DN6237_c0_g1_i5:105-578(+)